MGMLENAYKTIVCVVFFVPFQKQQKNWQILRINYKMKYLKN